MLIDTVTRHVVEWFEARPETTRRRAVRERPVQPLSFAPILSCGYPTPVLTTITTWSLQMLRAEMLIPAPRPPSTAAPGLAFERVIAPTPAFARYLYTAVGGDWHWHDRLSWTHARWQRWLDREQVSIWLAWQGGAPGGYIELEQQSQGDVEIVYFGLLPQAIGTGLGAWLLYTGSARAWALPGTRRVWVHTCSLDHPRALDNYRRRGFEVFRTEQTERVLPPISGPWPGAYRQDGDR